MCRENNGRLEQPCPQQPPGGKCKGDRKQLSSLQYKILFPWHFCTAHSLLEEDLSNAFHATLKDMQARKANAARAWMEMGELQSPHMSVWEEMQDPEEGKDRLSSYAHKRLKMPLK